MESGDRHETHWEQYGQGYHKAWLAQTAAIMQPSKSHYHCNGTDGVGGETMDVWESERDEVEGCSHSQSPPFCLEEKCVQTHKRI